jgi:hypothetical protein
MSTFRVAFDGKWQEDFDTLADAVEWAQEVALTGRMTYVIERRRLFSRFRAAFPEERADELRKHWKKWSWPSGGGGGG